MWSMRYVLFTTPLLRKIIMLVSQYIQIISFYGGKTYPIGIQGIILWISKRYSVGFYVSSLGQQTDEGNLLMLVYMYFRGCLGE